MVFANVGLPLTDIFEILKENDLQPDFYSFVKGSQKQGWKTKTILNRLEHSLVDSYGKDYWLGVESRLKEMLK